MFDFLLNEKNVSSLKEYVSFLNDLPVALDEIKRFSDAFQRSGHTMMTPPDAQALTQAAVANAGRWRAILMVVPSLAMMGRQLVAEADTFTREFAQVAQHTAGAAGRVLMQNVDPLRFTPINVGQQGTNRPPDILYLINNLCVRLDQYAKVAAHFKTLVVDVSQTIHSIFVRFIDSLALRLCVCDAPVSKIEAYYSQGRIGLPNMPYDTGGYYSEEQRREKAREHLRMLGEVYVRAISAGNNLADFCHRLNHFVTCVKVELQSNDPQCSLRRAKSSMAQVAHPLQQLDVMVSALERLSPKYQP
ncbi:hypothetical protein [Pseudomonas sp. T1.Ur]|uniref:hypothetical protein n=1 Tax=Pseudomonas sp. T1.Ur TaxID=2928704 RepID=UPI00201E4BD7|nr:hypothetical protein [Pseudomonas sp. T1.Ur]MCL6703883.1 hypothetical protein [Pseudomonas sp. T1.Ur]